MYRPDVNGFNSIMSGAAYTWSNEYANILITVNLFTTSVKSTEKNVPPIVVVFTQIKVRKKPVSAENRPKFMAIFKVMFKFFFKILFPYSGYLLLCAPYSRNGGFPDLQS